MAANAVTHLYRAGPPDVYRAGPPASPDRARFAIAANSVTSLYRAGEAEAMRSYHRGACDGLRECLDWVQRQGAFIDSTQMELLLKQQMSVYSELARQSEHRPAESASTDGEPPPGWQAPSGSSTHAGAAQPELPAYIPTDARGAAASDRGSGIPSSFPSGAAGGFASPGGGGAFSWGGDSRKRRLDDAFGRAVMEGDAGAGNQTMTISPAKQPRLSHPLPLPTLNGAGLPGWSETDKVWYM